MNTEHPITTYRRERSISQEDLRKMLGVSRWTITAIETGIRRPSPKLATEIEAKTGIPRDVLRPDLWGAQ